MEERERNAPHLEERERVREHARELEKGWGKHPSLSLVWKNLELEAHGLVWGLGGGGEGDSSSSFP